MLTRNPRLTSAGLLVMGLVHSSTAISDEKPRLRAQTTAEGIAISEGNRPVLFYQRAPRSIDGRYERSGYVHPLYDLDGDVLTEDFPKDHLHQRGIYWAWHQVWVGDKRVGDPWAIQNFAWDVYDAQVSDEPTGAVSILAQVHWLSPLWRDDQGKLKPLVREASRIRVHPSTGDLRKVDFQIELLALESGLRIGGSEDEKGYSGFSLRVRLPNDVRFSGRDGVVEPKVEAVAAGPWMDISASFSERGTSGITVLCHPSSPGFPQPWVIRSSRSMQNPAWPGRDAVPLPQDKPLALRYRLVLHRGPVSSQTADAWQAEYAKEAGAR
jgi:hypothetical protein